MKQHRQIFLICLTLFFLTGHAIASESSQAYSLNSIENQRGLVLGQFIDKLKKMPQSSRDGCEVVQGQTKFYAITKLSYDLVDEIASSQIKDIIGDQKSDYFLAKKVLFHPLNLEESDDEAFWEYIDSNQEEYLDLYGRYHEIFEQIKSKLSLVVQAEIYHIFDEKSKFEDTCSMLDAALLKVEQNVVKEVSECFSQTISKPI